VVAVSSMSKQEFSRREVLLRVQSGGLRVSDAGLLIGVRPARPLPALSATFLLVRIYDFSIRERHNRA
jgi:hypothetical protein